MRRQIELEGGPRDGEHVWGDEFACSEITILGLNPDYNPFACCFDAFNAQIDGPPKHLKGTYRIHFAPRRWFATWEGYE